MWNFFRHGEDTHAKTSNSEPSPQQKNIFHGVLADAQKHREIRDKKGDKAMMQAIAFGKNPTYASAECMGLATQFIDDKDVLLLLFKKPGVPHLVQENIVYRIFDQHTLFELKKYTQSSRVQWKIESKLQEMAHHENLLDAASSESYHEKIKSMNLIRDSGTLNNGTIVMLIDEFKKEASSPSPSGWYLEAIIELIPRSQTSDEYKYETITELEGVASRMEHLHTRQMLISRIANMKQNHVCLLNGKKVTADEPAEE